MRTPSISDNDLVDRLGEVFGRYGVEGANLNRLSDAAGLKRASLYHRFPGGKSEILQAVVDRTAERFGDALSCAFEDGTPAERAAKIVEAIRTYYEGGRRSCLIAALSIADDDERVAAVQCVDAWTAAFARIAKDAGADAAEAEAVALDGVAGIEGALVIAATSGQLGPFDRALAKLPELLTGSW